MTTELALFSALVSTVTLDSLTVTSCVATGSLSAMFWRRGLPAATVTLAGVKGAKPWAATEMVYAAGREGVDGVSAVAAAGGDLGHTILTGDSDTCRGHDGTRGVGHGAMNASRGGLGGGHEHTEQEEQTA